MKPISRRKQCSHCLKYKQWTCNAVIPTTTSSINTEDKPSRYCDDCAVFLFHNLSIEDKRKVVIVS